MGGGRIEFVVVKELDDDHRSLVDLYALSNSANVVLTFSRSMVYCLWPYCLLSAIKAYGQLLTAYGNRDPGYILCFVIIVIGIVVKSCLNYKSQTLSCTCAKRENGTTLD